MSLNPTDFILDTDAGIPPVDLGHPPHARGLIPRDYQTHPVGYIAPPMRDTNIPLIPRREWSERIKAQVADKARLSDVRMTAANGAMMPGLCQNGTGNKDGSPRWGYCWAHSSAHCVQLIRAVNNQPYVPLSAFAVACVIKRGRNEGGWGALSLEFIQSVGIPSQEFWPQQNDDMRFDTPAMRANAARHKVAEGWVDLESAVYDRDLTFNQVATCLLSGVPVVGDFNWWGHSVCLMDLVEVSPGNFGVRILNSWDDSWGDKGTAVLTGSKAIPDGAVAPRTVAAAG